MQDGGAGGSRSFEEPTEKAPWALGSFVAIIVNSNLFPFRDQVLCCIDWQFHFSILCGFIYRSDVVLCNVVPGEYTECAV